jgi:hypothetical protein
MVMDAAKSTHMLTEYEAQKLQCRLKRQWNAASSMVPTCAVLLSMIVVLSLIGSWNEPQREVAGGIAAEQKNVSLQYRREVSAAESGTKAEERSIRLGTQSLPQAQRNSAATGTLSIREEVEINGLMP